MLSYLDTVKKVVADSIYARGVKLYLEGGITHVQTLILDFWREYRFQSEYDVRTRMPILHLALDSSKYDKASEALSEVVLCTCSYFNEFGVCKHVVAACAQLEQEFNPDQSSSSKQLYTETKSPILDSIFEVETERKIRRWENDLERYINGLIKDLYWFDEAVSLVAKQPEVYNKFTLFLEQVVQKSTSYFETELRLLDLVRQSLYFGGSFWWNFWKRFIPAFEHYHQVKLWTTLWKMYVAGIFLEFQADFLDDLKNLDEEMKKEVLTKLQKEFQNQKTIWVNFALESRYISWLEQHMNQFDPVFLIRLYDVMPEKQQEIEVRLQNQVRVWSDFLQSGNYDELVNVLQQWQSAIGKTEMFDESVKYVKDLHKKKKKLITAIQKYL